MTSLAPRSPPVVCLREAGERHGDLPIFAHENGQRIAINPDHVVNLTEIEPQRILISFPNEGSVTVELELESVIARLTGQRDLRSE